MANDIKVNLNLDSNVSNTAKEAKKLRLELEAAAKAAGGINTNNKAAGNTKAYQAAMQSASTTTENIEYGVARSMGAGTGAAGRDFAKQAQGLGGLVHVYATFAANLFAVSAAFTALKNAADTTNMIKGLDQLGAASGRGLGSLSKEIVKLTDGAVTMREAMEATAKATAAGMSSADLKRLAVGAKNASQALGVDMSDALSRLSRGITKLEPELLDELGIFVRVDKAAADYARTLGKPASALTDFEKRAAFATATLDQVEKKFGSIKIDSNPYNQLLSSLKEVMQTGLEVINTFLEPILRLLAASPTGLAVAIASVGTMLLKQAIPALGSVKESMRAAAEVSTKVANQKMVEAKRASMFELEEAKRSAEATADFKLAQSEASQQKLLVSQANSFKKSSKAYEILNMNYADIEDKHFAQLEKQFKRFEKTDPAVAQRYRVAIDGLKEWVAAEQNLTAVSLKAAAEYEKSHGRFSTIGQLQAAANKANQEAMSRQITSNAAYTASLQGPIKALQQLNKEIKEARSGGRVQEVQVPVYDRSGQAILDEQGKQVTKLEKLTIEKMGAMRAGWTRLTGAISIATTAVGTFMNAFGTWMAVAGLVIAGVSILIDKFSATTKETKATNEAFNALSSSVENMDRVLSRLETIDPLEKLSVENIQAKATALTELSTSITMSVKKAFDEAEKMNWLDKEINTIKGYFGADLSDTLAENLGNGISTALKSAVGSKEAEEARIKIANILGNVNLDDPKALKAVIESMLDSGRLTKVSTLELSKAIEILGQKSAAAAAKGTELKSAMEVTNKAAQDVTASFLPSDAISKFGMSIMAESVKIAQALEEPTQRLNALKGLLENPTQLAILDDATREVFLANREAIQDAIIASDSYTNGIAYLTKEIERLNAVKEDIYTSTSSGIVDTDGIQKTQDQIDALTNAVEQYKSAQAGLAGSLSGQGGINFDNIGIQMFKKGAEYFNQSVGAELAKAASQVTKAYTALAPNTATASAVNVKADNAQLVVERELIKTNMGLIDAIYENTQVTQIATLKREKQIEEEKDNKDAIKIAALDKSIKQLETSLAFVRGDKARLAAGGKPLDIGSLAEAGVDAATIERYMKLAGSNAAIFSKNMQIAANNIKLAIEQAKIEQDREMERLDASQKLNDLSLKRIGVVGTINGLLAPELLSAKQNLEITNQELENKKNISKATFEYNNVLKMIQQTGMENTKEAKKDISNAKDRLDLAEKTGKAEIEALREKQALEATTNRVGVEKQLLDLQIQRGSIAILSVDAQLMREQTLAQLRLDTIAQEATISAANKAIEDQRATISAAKSDTDKKNAEDTLAGLEAQKALSEEVYSVKQKITQEQSNMNIAMAQANEIAVSLNSIFAGMATSIGEFATSAITNFEKMNISAQQYADTMAKAESDKKKAQAIVEDPTSSAEEILKAQQDITKAEKVANLAKKQSMKDELTGNALILGSAKKLFNEKSTGYKILATVEKAMHIAKLSMIVAEMFMDKTATTSAVVNSGAKQAANMGEAATGAVASITNQGKGDPYTAFARIAAMVALMASVMSMFGQSGGGDSSVSMISVPTSEQLQETQGTGQDYQSGTLNLVANGGGVLGDISARSEDIANSISYMEEYSFETLIYNNKMLTSLKDIEVNTREFVSQLAASGYTGNTSPLGTLAQTSSTKGSSFGLGPINLFSGGSSSTSTSVEDWGIQISGALSSVLKGAGKLIGYELVKEVNTSTKSSFFGIGGGSSTSTSYYTNEVALNDNIKLVIQRILGDVKDTVLTFGDNLASVGTVQLTDAINNSLIDFKISTKGLTGQQVYDAIVGELGITANKIVATAYPFLSTFQQFGEGLLTTLTRVSTNMQTVDVMFKQMGIDFANKFLNPVMDAGNVNLTKNIAIYEDLINKFGGDLNTFVEKTQFYIDNFIDPNNIYIAHLDAVSKEMARLGYSSINTKSEFTDLVNSLDLSTDAGRALYVSLMNVAPGFDVINKHVQDLLNAAGIAMQDFSGILMDAILGKSDITEIGDKIASTIKEGVLNAVASSYVTSITTAFNDLLITPIITAINTGTTLTAIITEKSISEITQLAISSARALSEIFNNVDFVNAIETTTSLISSTIKKLGATAQLTTGSINKIFEKYNTKIIDAYKKQASEIQNTITKFQGFSTTLKEFRDSLLLSATSTLTPVEKYNKALEELNTTYGLAAQGDETALGKIKTVAQTFLDISREFYGSSEAYTSDFSRVQNIIDSTINLVDAQKTDMERQLDISNEQLSVLGFIEENTKTVAELLAEANTNKNKEVGDLLVQAFSSLDRDSSGFLNQSELVSGGITDNSQLRAILSILDRNSDLQISMWEALNPSSTVVGFANGGYHSGGIRIVGENGPELEATGQARIWTANQTRQILSSSYSNNNSNNDLVFELRKLNDKINSLEQTVQQGDILNAQATERNTQQVSETIKDTSSTSTYTTRLQNKAAIV